MQKVMVFSDAHFGHKNILKFRKGFSSIQEHDELIMENILSGVNKHDTLWLLGDMFFDRESLENMGQRIVDHCPQTHLVLGNHDTDSATRAQNVRAMTDMFQAVYGMKSKYGFWMTHCPMHPNETRGKVNIHGHVHYQTIHDPNYFNAAGENINFRPVDIRDIRDGYRGELYEGPEAEVIVERK